MKKARNILLSITILSIIQPGAFAQMWQGSKPPVYVNSSGADIQAFSINGKQFKGELISVQENSLMLYNSSTCVKGQNWWECVDKINKANIQKLVIKGNSNVWAGIGIGTALGLLSILFTVDFNPHPEGLFNMPELRYSEGVTIGAVLGCIIAGGIIGALTSTPDEVIEPFSEYDISGLSVHSRYPRGMPQKLSQEE
jgi:hypothetical protein